MTRADNVIAFPSERLSPPGEDAPDGGTAQVGQGPDSGARLSRVVPLGPHRRGRRPRGDRGEGPADPRGARFHPGDAEFGPGGRDVDPDGREQDPDGREPDLDGREPDLDGREQGPDGRGLGEPGRPISRALEARRGRRAGFRVFVSVAGSAPVIWRRLDLASDLGLGDTFEVVRSSFGWSGHLLHRFRALQGRDGREGLTFSPAYGRWPRAGLDESGIRLDEVLARAGDVLDLELVDEGGDEWTLTLLLEEIGAPPRDRPAVCVDGERARPPVDADGIDSYNIAVAQWYAGVPAAARLGTWPQSHDPEAFELEAGDALVRLVSARPRQARVLTPVVADLRSRCLADGVRILDALIADAGLDRPLDPPSDPAAVVSGWARLLRRLGTGSPEGALAPSERALVAPAVTLGLVRKTRAQIVPTLAGRRLGGLDGPSPAGAVGPTGGGACAAGVSAGPQGRGDPEGLWWHLASRLPCGRGARQDAAVVTMLQLAAAGRAWPQVSARILDSAGHLDRGETVGAPSVHRWSAPLWAILAGCTGGPSPDPAGEWSAREVGEDVRRLCRAALAPRGGGGAAGLARDGRPPARRRG